MRRNEPPPTELPGDPQTLLHTHLCWVRVAPAALGLPKTAKPGLRASLVLMEAACFVAQTNPSKAEPQCAHTPMALKGFAPTLLRCCCSAAEQLPANPR